jgi:hypothetical protein
MAMTKRRRWLIQNLPILFLSTAVIWFLTRPDPKIDHDNYKQIQHGMTLAEVESIIGAAPGNYGGANPNGYGGQACQGWICDDLFQDWRYGTPTRTLEEIQAKLEQGRIAVWTGPEHAIGVQLDGEDRVVGAGLGFRGLRPSWWERLLARVGIR